MQQLDAMAEVIRRFAREGPCTTIIPNLDLYCGSATAAPLQALDNPDWFTPALCVIVQGRKRGLIGTRSLVLEAASFVIVAVDLPVLQAVFETAGDKPFLGMRLRLDVATIHALLLEFPEAAIGTDPAPLASAGTLSPALADALSRLAALLSDPTDAALLAPGIEREICYRLLRGPHGRFLQQVVNADSRLGQVKRAIDWMRRRYADPLRIDDMAAIARMSPSSFHQHFKAVTAMSPLQFQKRLRLSEARRLMCAEGIDAATAGFKVGYESPSQFSREYKKLFGQPPARDAALLADQPLWLPAMRPATRAGPGHMAARLSARRDEPGDTAMRRGGHGDARL